MKAFWSLRAGREPPRRRARRSSRFRPGGRAGRRHPAPRGGDPQLRVQRHDPRAPRPSARVRVLRDPVRRPRDVLEAECGDVRELTETGQTWALGFLSEILDMAHGRWLWSEAAKARWRLRDVESSLRPAAAQAGDQEGRLPSVCEPSRAPFPRGGPQRGGECPADDDGLGSAPDGPGCHARLQRLARAFTPGGSGRRCGALARDPDGRLHLLLGQSDVAGPDPAAVRSLPRLERATPRSAAGTLR